MIKIENILKEFEEYKGTFKDKYEERKKKRINEKMSLLKSIGIDQDTLDTYMSYIQLDEE